ncbi:sirohydrochlorin chelatase [Mycobacterium nebraskense]|uniref:Sirohydrochlorin ferrochelatase n=2 Tax=Mycobacterium nebraskense TaxID=244292 RepID=A0A1X2A170_9MYCO|nr:sirohydrochlorin chelatase [Mycobacterium nebraskense]KLO34107.1 sirohydrochlorin ferrochelatase [Mycobacterium nebraskense]MBI2696028.1 sirohydrochlorin chelatase [Mycobacterium nebraskense]MCV7116449.1 sirohydrochlorin chelatase [Mycobacterium nebraskense]ORW34776.1 sirohydrochlorin ferrochelatase [Mycobacterium nebraskense]
MSTLVLTAHGSRDPRSGANAQALADRLASMRTDLDVRLAFLELNAPNFVDVLAGLPDSRRAVVAPLLLASAYHARLDIPRQIARAGAHGIRQADVLGEDERLVSVLRERLTEVGVSAHDDDLGVMVVAIGSSNPAANVRTAKVASRLAVGTRWAGATTAFATRPEASVHRAASYLRRRGAGRLVIAPWFLAPGLLTDGVSTYARDNGIPMAAPLGAHRLVAETVLDRYDEAMEADVAA